MSLAPILLFVYNRPWHTKKTIEFLRKNILSINSDLFVYSDGPKNDKDKVKVEEIRNYFKEVKGFKNITVIERDKNFGLAESIIQGVTEIVNKYGKAIVLEDDLVTSPYFLTFMNHGLDIYENEERVISIHGYIYPVKEKLPDTFFLKGADCWGWATWRRGWNLFEKDGKKLLNEIKQKKLTKEFDFDNFYPYTKMLEDQITGKNNSWAIRWYASAFLKEKLTLYPGRSLIKNIGFDGTGTHSGNSEIFNEELNIINPKINRILISEDLEVKKAIKNFFKRDLHTGRIISILRKICLIFR